MCARQFEEDPRDEWVRRLCYQHEPPDKAERDIADWADLDIVVLRFTPRVVLKV